MSRRTKAHRTGKSMAGKTVVVTGANSGIGLETAAALAAMGARTVLTARDQARGASAVKEIEARGGSGTAELVTFDLGTVSSVKAGAAEILERCPTIDVLVNNAGVILTQRTIGPDDIESTLAINHLGPFLLTTLLLDRIKASAPARIVNVSSTAHSSAKRGMNFADLQYAHGYKGMEAYGASKLANILFTTELARRLESTGVTVNCLHPGVVNTGWGRDGDTKGFLKVGLGIAKPFMMTPIKGAATSIYLASSPDVSDVSGRYFVKSRAKSPSAAAQDAAAAARLWTESEALLATAGAPTPST